jgi:hypothetical protein
MGICVVVSRLRFCFVLVESIYGKRKVKLNCSNLFIFKPTIIANLGFQSWQAQL